jgi:hypothetical protein
MLNDGRKGKGTTLFAVQKKVAVVDPCSSASPDYAVNWAGFPAYAFVRDTTSGSTASYEIRVASRNGVCSKRVGDVQPRGPYNLSFARSADPALPYIIAWVGSGIGIQIARFTLDGASETTIPANVALFRSNAYSPDLSTDGTSLAYTTSSAQYLWNLRIASLADSDTTGAGDTTLLSYENRDVTSLTWAPWGRIYYKTLDLTNGRQLMGIDPALPPGSQASESLLQLPANAPLQVSVLFDFGRFTSGYVGYDAAGPVPQLVFQGYYTTGLKGPGKSSGTSCAAVYSLHAVSHAFLIGSVTSPSPITGFSPSVTRDATALYEQSTAPSSGSTCNRTGYVGESALASGYTTSISNGVAGSWPAALKNP